MEKILFSPKFNQSEFLRTLAKFSNPQFGLRILNELEILSYIQERTCLFLEGNLISAKEENYLFYKIMGTNYKDAKNLRNSINTYRTCIIDQDVLASLENNLSDDFPKKKELIIENFRKYDEIKRSNYLYDKIDLINFLLDSCVSLDVEVIYLVEYDISPLFLKLLESVFSKVTKKSILDLFKNYDNNCKFLKSYGKKCEVDYVLSSISSLPLDECQIILTSPSSYIVELTKQLEILGVPYTSTIGEKVISSKVGSLLKSLLNLEDSLFSINEFLELVNSPFFNREYFYSLIPEEVKNKERVLSEFVGILGHRRVSYGFNVNDLDESLYEDYYQKLAFPLAKEFISFFTCRSEFISKVIKDPSEDDIKLINNIRNLEGIAASLGVDIVPLLDELLSSNMNKEISQSGKLHITTIQEAASSLRKYNFIVGLDSSYPGGPKEDYLIYDEEYIKTGFDNYISSYFVKNKEVLLRNLIKICENCSLSYSYFNLASLEDSNPSSVIFSLTDVDKIPNYDYSDLTLDMNQNIYLAKLDNNIYELPKKEFEFAYKGENVLSKVFSPSAFVDYFSKEMKLKFILQYIFDISIVQEENIYDILPPNFKGSLIHKVFENFNKSKISEEEILKKAEKEFNDYLEQRPALIKLSIEKVKENYLSLISSLYKISSENIHVKSEDYISLEIEGITFGGKYDRLEKSPDGTYILIDYKTGRTLKHKNEDAQSCLQGLIYAYMIENTDKPFYKGIKISKIRFLYPALGQPIEITYSLENKEKMLEYVRQFKNDIVNGDIFDGLKLSSQKYYDQYMHLLSLFKEDV